MNDFRGKTPVPTLTRRQTLWTLGGLGLQLAGCGGGGTDIAGLSTGGTGGGGGSFTVGPILGLGSIIVNGIRYDDRAATVSRLDGDDTPGVFKLGMVVNIQGGQVSGDIAAGTATATAQRIAYDSEWKGPVSATDLTASTFTLLGQTVKVSATTVWEPGTTSVTGLSLLDTSHFVEVYGFLDANNATLEATRVEMLSARPERFKLSGQVKATGSGTFEVGALTIQVSNSTEFSGVTANTLTAGTPVRVRLENTLTSGQAVATRVKAPDNLLSTLEVEDDHEVELKGSVTSAPAAGQFAVNGVPVNATAIAGWASLNLAIGTVVEVKGRIVSGQVKASKIEVETEDEREAREYEFRATVAPSDIDAGQQRFRIKGYTVAYDAATEIADDLGAWPLTSARSIKVKAKLMANGLLATEIEKDG